MDESGSKPTGVVYHPDCLKHKPQSGHPECPERLTAIVDRLRSDRTLSDVRWLTPKAAEQRWIRLVHEDFYIGHVRALSNRGPAVLDGGDTSVDRGSYEAACLAAGGVLAAIDEVLAGNIRNAFCAVRPPGHHAFPDRGTGFCIFNNVAIGARYVQQRHGMKRVLIVDWDVHHGNGTQDIFYEDPSVLYFSTHQYPFYPGPSGAAENVGRGEGKGFTINVPVPAGTGDDRIREHFVKKLVPAADRFRPEFILISCGFDAHRDDMLGGLKMTSEGFGELTRIVKGLAERHCGGRLVSVLEGGYTLEAIAEAAAQHVRALSKRGP